MEDFQIFASPYSQIRVSPMHGGHHSVWSGAYHADICNMIDDLLVRNMQTGELYRFPLTVELFPWVQNLFMVMGTADVIAKSPWAHYNARVRYEILTMVRRRLEMQARGTQTEAEGGNVVEMTDPLERNEFSPGNIAPAIQHSSADRVIALLARKIRKDGADCLVV